MHETDKVRMIGTTTIIFTLIFLVSAGIVWGNRIMEFLTSLGPQY